MLLRFYSTNPKSLLAVGVICSGYGAYLFKKGFDGDTIVPGTKFTRLPRWFFYAVGGILQVPLPLAYWFLKSQGAL